MRQQTAPYGSFVTVVTLALVTGAPHAFSQDKAFDRDPKAVRDVLADGSQILDRWEQTIGIGQAATNHMMIKIRRPTGNIEVLRVSPDREGAFPAAQPLEPRPVTPRDKIADRLHAQFTAENADEKLPAIVWLVEPPQQAEAPGTRQEPDRGAPKAAQPPAAETQANRQKLSQVLERIQSQRGAVARRYGELIDAFLTAAELRDDVIYRYSQAPAVVVRASWERIQSIAGRPDVRFVFAVEPAQPELATVVPASLSARMHTEGWTGAGVPVAIVGEAGRVERSNPHLSIPSADQRFPMAATDSHATGIAGIIGARGASLTGVAPGCRVLCAPREGAATSVSVDAAADWALAQGAVILTTSQGWHQTSDGALHWSDIYVDYVVQNSRVLWVKSAGNRGASGDHGRVTSPGRGFNSLAVGNIDELASIDWSDDVMAQTSSYLNPETGGEKPELSAYGSSITSTLTFSPWIGSIGSGTSYAAPMVAGFAALCVEREPELADEPQTLKAMLMASAIGHNVEAHPTLSDRDGAGAAKASALHSGFYSLTVADADFDSDGLFEIPVDVQLTTNDTQRVVLCYPQPPISESANPTVASYRKSDLDLELHVGTKVAESNYGDHNPFEIIDYLPPAAGLARIKIRRVHWHPQTADLRIGIAWINKSMVEPPPSEPENAPSSAEIITALTSLGTAEREAVLRAVKAQLRRP